MRCEWILLGYIRIYRPIRFILEILFTVPRNTHYEPLKFQGLQKSLDLFGLQRAQLTCLYLANKTLLLRII